MAATPITQAQLDALRTTLRARFNAGLAAGSEDWKKVAGFVKSDNKSNTYAWLTQFPAFREWVGTRQHMTLRDKAFVVENKKFEATIDVQRTDVEDDNLGHYASVAEGHGQAVIDLKNDIVFKGLLDGFGATCYDGQYLFDADHPVYPNEDGSGTATTVSNYQDGSDAPWVLLCTKRAAKALYLQERLNPQFESQTSAASPDVFNLDVYSFGGRWRGNVAYGFWQCAFGSKAPLSAANFNAAYDSMMGVKGDGNRQLGIMADTLVVGPSNRVAAENLLLKQVLDGGGSNTLYKRCELVVTPWLP